MAGAADIKAGRAYVELMLKDSAFAKGLKASSDKLKSFGKGTAIIGAAIAGAGAAITGPILAAVHQFASGGDALSKMSMRTGVSAKALSELGFAAEQSGQDMETLESSLKKMQKTIGGALTGNGEAARSLHVLGIGLDELKGKSPDQQFEVIAEALSKIQDPTIRASRAMAIFGKSGTALLPMMLKGAAGIRALREEAQDLGLSKSEEDVALAAKLEDAFKKLGRVTSGIWSKIGSAVASTVLETTERVTSVIVAVGKWIKQNKDLFVTIYKVGVALTIAGTAIGLLGAGIAAAGVVVGGLATGLGAIGTVLGVILSPIGLITAALIAGGVVWAMYTESGQAAVSAVVSGLKELLRIAMQTFGGIMDAIKGGDLALAGKIAITGLQVAMLEGFAALADAIGGTWGDLIGKLGSQLASGDFSGAWDTAIESMGAIWDSFCNGIVGAFTKAAHAVADVWKNTTTAIANWILKDAEAGGILGTAALAGTGIDIKTEEGKKKVMRQQERLVKGRMLDELHNAKETGAAVSDGNGGQLTPEEIDRQIAELQESLDKLSGAQSTFLEDAQKNAAEQISGTADAIHAALNEYDRSAEEQAEKSKAGLASRVAGGGSAAHDAAVAAQAKLDELTRQATAAAEAQRKKEEDRKASLEGAGKGEEVAGLGKEVMGSFSAAALAAGGATGSPIERVAKAAEKQNDLLDATIGLLGQSHEIQSKTLDAVRDGGNFE